MTFLYLHPDLILFPPFLPLMVKSCRPSRLLEEFRPCWTAIDSSSSFFKKKFARRLITVSPIITLVSRGTLVKSPQSALGAFATALVKGLRVSPSLFCVDAVVNLAMHVLRECRQTWGPPSPAFAPVPVDYLRMPAFDETTSPSSPCHPVPVNGVFLFLLLLLRLPLLLFQFLLLKIQLSLALLLQLSMITLSLKPMLERVFSF